MDLSVALENILRLFTDITFIPFAVGFVVVVTQIIKNVFKVEGNRAALISIAVQTVVWIVYSFFKSRGQDAQFENVIRALESILNTLVSVLFPALLGGIATQATYNKVAEKRVPGFRAVSKPKQVSVVS